MGRPPGAGVADPGIWLSRRSQQRAKVRPGTSLLAIRITNRKAAWRVISRASRVMSTSGTLGSTAYCRPEPLKTRSMASRRGVFLRLSVIRVSAASPTGADWGFHRPLRMT